MVIMEILEKMSIPGRGVTLRARWEEPKDDSLESRKAPHLLIGTNVTFDGVVYEIRGVETSYSRITGPKYSAELGLQVQRVTPVTVNVAREVFAKGAAAIRGER